MFMWLVTLYFKTSLFFAFTQNTSNCSESLYIKAITSYSQPSLLTEHTGIHFLT